MYGNVNPLFERTIEPKVAERFVDHAAFVKKYLRVVALTVKLPLPAASNVVPGGVPTSHETEPTGVPAGARQRN